ncbi:hypothetical protein VE01_01491 [Pseudogymnoascus verrucosus]|uniref:L-ornithine N(5)-monooxygenase [NAD(P)H] n=1 Tax=Pseudogymnoascus verrucosus TaxID=342668 RepID=A0A1B8GX99_9PEZI|nr:uncharacterized protein VE01_01491 [Pseudogymnoascus verrucosus]OBU00456.1 hypothetical protein VE01_01491 [Pseudogymnoascus verrucosus]
MANIPPSRSRSTESLFSPGQSTPTSSVGDNSSDVHSHQTATTTPSTTPPNTPLTSLTHASLLSPSTTSPTTPLSLLTIGFGPASLAIAIALSDHLSSSPSSPSPPVLFLEKQPQFAWHSGMQLAGTHMQISFLKDLATPRDPTSPFSFLNYLFTKGRLQKFINLGTFLPARREYEDYMRWCASHFSRAVRYGTEITRVDAVHNSETGKVDRFNVHWVDTATGAPGSATARNIVVATGGSPAVPTLFAPFITGPDARFIHSSQYATSIPHLSITVLSPPAPQHLVVIGGGQSAAEIYVDLSTRCPESKITLLVKDTSLRPSDDSPFVNEIFDPDRVTPTFEMAAKERMEKRERDKGTNYGVVRLELLERIYSELYAQEVDEPCEEKWRCRVLNSRTVVGVQRLAGEEGQGVRLEVARTGVENGEREVLEAGLVVFATGYVRDAHVRILDGTRGLLEAERGVAETVGAPAVEEAAPVAEAVEEIAVVEEVAAVEAPAAVEEAVEELPAVAAPVPETAVEAVAVPEAVTAETVTETPVTETPEAVATPAQALPAAAVVAETTKEVPATEGIPVTTAPAEEPVAETTSTTTTEIATETTAETTTETTPEPESNAASVDEVKVSAEVARAPAVFPVGRDYKVQYAEGAVEEGAGIWLQGCNEKTHGLSDTLLSILAHRGGEVVQSIFGPSNTSK